MTGYRDSKGKVTTVCSGCGAKAISWIINSVKSETFIFIEVSSELFFCLFGSGTVASGEIRFVLIAIESIRSQRREKIIA